MKIKAAIATTLINGEDVIDSFVNYHLAIGFHHIYLFFDDPNDPNISKFQSVAKVTAIAHNNELRRLWTQTSLYRQKQDLHRYVDIEAMSRQMLNMSVACEMAKREGIDWILHIDIDELFYLPDGQSAESHFAELSRNGVPFSKYVNYEAIPEKSDIADFFKDVTLFKRNHDHYSFYLKYFRRSMHVHFNYYEIGKAAAQIDKIDMPLLHYIIPKKEKRSIRMHFYLNLNKTRNLAEKILGTTLPSFPLILHYPVCGFKHFVNKYQVLGNFEDKWFGKHDVLPFHKRSRDLFRTGNVEEMKIFFEQKIMVDQQKIDDGLKAGSLIRISRPSEFIKTVVKK
jgi:hypothetical protein